MFGIYCVSDKIKYYICYNQICLYETMSIFKIRKTAYHFLKSDHTKRIVKI